MCFSGFTLEPGIPVHIVNSVKFWTQQCWFIVDCWKHVSTTLNSTADRSESLQFTILTTKYYWWKYLSYILLLMWFLEAKVFGKGRNDPLRGRERAEFRCSFNFLTLCDTRLSRVCSVPDTSFVSTFVWRKYLIVFTLVVSMLITYTFAILE